MTAESEEGDEAIATGLAATGVVADDNMTPADAAGAAAEEAGALGSDGEADAAAAAGMAATPAKARRKAPRKAGDTAAMVACIGYS